MMRKTYPTSCTSGFCGETECPATCPNLPALTEFKKWVEDTGRWSLTRFGLPTSSWCLRRARMPLDRKTTRMLSGLIREAEAGRRPNCFCATRSKAKAYAGHVAKQTKSEIQYGDEALSVKVGAGKILFIFYAKGERN